MDKLQLNNIELKIVQFLFENENQYQPSQRIAKNIQVSNKTVRKYLNSMSTVVEEFGAEIEMKKGSGYRLVIENSSQFYQFIDVVWERRNAMEDSQLLINNKDRERFILNALLLENQLLTIDDLSDLMFISKSTVSKIIQMIKKRLAEFSLDIAYSQAGHIKVNGEELEKRRFILHYFLSYSPLDNHINMDLFEYQYEGFSAETIFIIVLEKCREFEIQLSDFVLQNLVLHIALAIKRNEKGFSIDKVSVDENIEYSKELFVAEKIVANIKKLIGIQFSKNEAKYIALHLKSKSNNPYAMNVRREESEVSLQEQIMAVLMQLKSQQEFYFSMDQQLIMGLKTHFAPLLTRLKLKIKLKNPLLDEVKEKYREVFGLTKKYFSRMPILADYQVDDHEWAYICLHLLAAVERYKQDHKVNVVVICATGLGSAQMLKNRLENEFSANMNIVDVISYYQLNDEILKNVDLIVTTIDISTIFYKIPVVKVSVFLSKKDIDALNKYMNHFILKKEENSETKAATSQINELFQLYFNEERFIVFDRPISRNDLLNALIQTLTDANASFDEDLKNQIYIREQFGTVAFKEHVAFPHPSQPIGINSEIVVGLIPVGVQWDTEHPDVKLVVLMSPSKIENKGLDIINSGLAEFISSDDNIERTLEQSSFNQFRKLFIDTLSS